MYLYRLCLFVLLLSPLLSRGADDGTHVRQIVLVHGRPVKILKSGKTQERTRRRQNNAKSAKRTRQQKLAAAALKSQTSPKSPRCPYPFIRE